MPGISISGVSYHTPQQRIIFKELNLNIPQSIVAITGENGIGKSTLLRLISEENYPNAGSIQVTGSVNHFHQFPEGHSAQISGGQEQIARLRTCFESQADFLLLDEPSNNLDVSAITWLIRQTQSYHRGILIVSHDPRLLELARVFIDITSIGVQLFIGSHKEFELQKINQIAQAERGLALSQAKEKRIKLATHKRLEKAQERSARGAKTARKKGADKILVNSQKERAEQGSSREKRLSANRLFAAQAQTRDAQKKHETLTPLHFDLPQVSTPSGRCLLDVKHLTFGYHQPIIKGFFMTVMGAEKIWLQGKNGSGKSTLMKLIQGTLKPNEGDIRLNARTSYLDQNLSTLNQSVTIFEQLSSNQGMLSDNQIYSTLARFKFRNQDTHLQISSLSGGEKLRVALAIAFAQTPPPELILLDEPTNNLDLNSREILLRALQGFSGAIIIASHDENFVRELGIDRYISIENN